MSYQGLSFDPGFDSSNSLGPDRIQSLGMRLTATRTPSPCMQSTLPRFRGACCSVLTNVKFPEHQRRLLFARLCMLKCSLSSRIGSVQRLGALPDRAKASPPLSSDESLWHWAVPLGGSPCEHLVIRKRQCLRAASLPITRQFLAPLHRSCRRSTTIRRNAATRAAYTSPWSSPQPCAATRKVGSRSAGDMPN